MATDRADRSERRNVMEDPEVMDFSNDSEESSGSRSPRSSNVVSLITVKGSNVGAIIILDQQAY
jgi:hypothetical protein